MRDMSSASLVKSLHDVGVQTATEHQQEQTAVRLSRVETYEGAFVDDLGSIFGFDSERTGQQIFGSQRQYRNRNVCGKMIDNQTDRAISPGSNDST